MHKRLSLMLPAILLAFVAGSIPANANLISNGSFEIATATTTTQFLSAGVSNWTNSDIGEALVFPSWYTNGYLFPPNVSFAGPVPQTSPDGGNFVFSDGDYHNSPITQSISGLIPSATYVLGFWEALSQDTEPFITVPGPVTGQWQVTFGTSTQYGASMTGNGATNTISPWTHQSLTFTASNATEVLSFFSIGSGDPPLVLLDGVTLERTPEPATLALFAIAAVLLGAKYAVRRRALARR
jgi:hypothetical protein